MRENSPGVVDTPEKLAKFILTPKAFANFSPGFEEREPWDR